MSEVRVKLHDPHPGPVNLPALTDGGTRLIYDVYGMEESGIHTAARVLPGIAPFLQTSSIPADKMDHANAALVHLFQVFELGKATFGDGFQLSDLMSTPALANGVLAALEEIKKL